MTYYGPVLSPEVQQESSAFADPMHISRMEGMELSLGHEFESIFEASRNYLKRRQLEKEDPGKMMTEDDWKKSEYFRPGMDVKGGISENVAKFEAEHWDNNRAYQAQLDAMPDGFLSSASSFVGGNIGALLNPIMMMTGTGMGVVAGKASVGLLENIASKTAARVAAGAIKGAAINVGFVAPATLADYISESELDQNPSGLAAIASVGMSVGLGGLIGGVGGALSKTARFDGIKDEVKAKTDQTADILKDKLDLTREIITRRSFFDARETAVNQFLNDKDVNVESILKNGYRAARETDFEKGLTDDEVSRETMKIVRNTLEEDHSKLRGETKAQEDLVNRITELAEKPELIEKIDRSKIEDLERKIAEKEFVAKRGGKTLDEKKLQEMEDETESLRDQIKHLKAIEALNEDRGVPVKGEEVKAEGEKINSYRGDTSYDAQNDIESKPDPGDNLSPTEARLKEHNTNMRDMEKLNAEQKENIKDMIKEGKLKEADIEEFNKTEEANKDFESLKRLIKQAGDCLKGVG